MVGVPDVIIRDKIRGDRFKGFVGAGVEFPNFYVVF